MNKLPVSIVCPVRNCIAEIPSHGAHLRELAEIIPEMIVVDSDSSDGTLDRLKQELAGLDVIFLNHPPGLYESWNHGIAAATQRYCTVATVGDPLPPESLRRLVETMEKYSADVAISAPEMISHRGGHSEKRWPIHQVLSESGIAEATLVDAAIWIVLTLGFFPATLMSSSAGNLYLTRMLQENPFPTAYGHAGDCLWALQMAHKARWVIDPSVKSYFWVHQPTANRKPRSEERARRVSKITEDFYKGSEDFLRAAGVPGDLLEIISRAPGQQLEKTLIQIEYAGVRRSWLPRFMQPEAARLKKMQTAIDRKIDARQKRALLFAKSLRRGEGKWII